MPAFRSGHGVVGDLVGRQAPCRRHLLRDGVKLGAELAVGHLELAGGMEPEERRALLDGELVERQMVGREADSLLQLASPGVRRLARPGVDQVEGEAGKGRPRDLDRPERLGDVVQPAEEFQVAVVERLDP